MKDNEKSSDLSVEEALPAYDIRYTYADYLLWDDDVRRELIDGVPHLMAAPNRRHQKLLGNLFVHFWMHLKGKTCEVYQAPFEVRLNAETYDDIVVQPDIIVVCDQSKLNDAGCKGVPDMVIEILSPSTARYDKTLKFNTYLKAGIREYWIIDPKDEVLAVHILKDNNYVTHVYTSEETVNVHVLEGCTINLADVFEE